MSKWILTILSLIIAICTAFTILTITDVIPKEVVWNYAGQVSWLAPHVEIYDIGRQSQEWLLEQQKLIDSAWEEIASARTKLAADQEVLLRKENSLARQERDLTTKLESRHKIEHLADLYTQMRTNEAVRILELMDTDLILQVILAMDSETASTILAGLPPEIAATLSEQFQ